MFLGGSLLSFGAFPAGEDDRESALQRSAAIPQRFAVTCAGGRKPCAFRFWKAQAAAGSRPVGKATAIRLPVIWKKLDS
jgi:hypothetical protein